ncbi:MAG: hypothetical protein E7272_12680 [Pseudobutyrivibrio ruminis]|uniref:Uncharacterized protein n=1 Tax=Pseudobutyrivibrio ruminis TaxID=46206 RepID=A0A927U995_9FIRM|nr:hypothetical protein [Pseudobutyrivibrio ruminis]
MKIKRLSAGIVGFSMLLSSTGLSVQAAELEENVSESSAVEVSSSESGPSGESTSSEETSTSSAAEDVTEDAASTVESDSTNEAGEENEAEMADETEKEESSEEEASNDELNEETTEDEAEEELEEEEEKEECEHVDEDEDGVCDLCGEIIEEEEEEIEDENLGKIIGFRDLGVVTFDYEPTADEIKETLPSKATAVVKGKESNDEISVSISFSDSAIEDIASQIADSKGEGSEATFTLKAEVSTSKDFAEGVSSPEVELRLVDEGFKLVFTELEDEETGIKVKGMMPENATLEVTEGEDVVATASTIFDEVFSRFDMENDSVDSVFLVNNCSVVVKDADGNVFTPEEKLLVTQSLTEEMVENIAGNQFSIYNESGDSIEHSFNADLREITFLSDSLEEQFTTFGIKTEAVYQINFEFRSLETDEVLFATESRYLQDTEIVLPEYIANEYEVLDWESVDQTAIRDASYVKYIDSKKYDVTKGDKSYELTVESYGDELTVENTEDEQKELPETTDTNDVAEENAAEEVERLKKELSEEAGSNDATEEILDEILYKEIELDGLTVVIDEPETTSETSVEETETAEENTETADTTEATDTNDTEAAVVEE